MMEGCNATAKQFGMFPTQFAQHDRVELITKNNINKPVLYGIIR